MIFWLWEWNPLWGWPPEMGLFWDFVFSSFFFLQTTFWCLAQGPGPGICQEAFKSLLQCCRTGGSNKNCQRRKTSTMGFVLSGGGGGKAVLWCLLVYVLSPAPTSELFC